MGGDRNHVSDYQRVIVHDARPSYNRRSYGQVGRGLSHAPVFRRHRNNGRLSIVLPYAVFLVVLVVYALTTWCGPIPSSTHVREKLDSGIGFDDGCIVDEIDWVYNPSGVAELLRRDFYDRTGVQPYVVFHAYDGTLHTDDDKERWARDYYAENIRRDDAFLYAYFAEPDTNTHVGYMTCVCGDDISGVMDAEAVRIFWAYVGQGWYGNGSTDGLIVSAFSDTADRIMDPVGPRSIYVVLALIASILVSCAVSLVRNAKWNKMRKRALRGVGEDK